MKRVYLFFAFAILATLTAGAQGRSAMQDLRKTWMKFDADRYAPVQDEDLRHLKTIYIPIDVNQTPGASLVIRSGKDYSVFVDGKIAATGKGELKLKLDSVAEVFFSRAFTVAIFQDDGGMENVDTWIESNASQTANAGTLELKPPTFFRDFAVVAGLILGILLIVAMNLNPKLARDYLSVTRIFSLREGDDSQMYTRITGSSNILFYVLCSLMLGFYLSVIFHFLPPEYALPARFRSANFWQAIGRWIQLSALVLVVFTMKIVLIYTLSKLFGLRDLAGLHFFNWMRLLLIVFGVTTIVVFIYFISRGHNTHFFYDNVVAGERDVDRLDTAGLFQT